MNQNLGNFNDIINLILLCSKHFFEKLNVINVNNTTIQTEKFLKEWEKQNKLNKIKCAELSELNKNYKTITKVYDIEKKSKGIHKYKLICHLKSTELLKLKNRYKNLNDSNFRFNVSTYDYVTIFIDCTNDTLIKDLKKDDNIELEFNLSKVEVYNSEGDSSLLFWNNIYGELINLKKTSNNAKTIKNILKKNIFSFYTFQTIIISLILIYSINVFEINYIFTYILISAVISIFTTLFIYKIIDES